MTRYNGAMGLVFHKFFKSAFHCSIRDKGDVGAFSRSSTAFDRAGHKNTRLVENVFFGTVVTCLNLLKQS